MGAMRNVSREWVEDVRQIETTHPVLGGDDGPLNYPSRDLAARTNYLKDRLGEAEKRLNDSGIGDNRLAVVVVSETEPTNLPVGGFWLQPVGEATEGLDINGYPIATKSDVDALLAQ